MKIIQLTKNKYIFLILLLSFFSFSKCSFSQVESNVLVIQSEDSKILSQFFEGIKEGWGSPIERKILSKNRNKLEEFLNEINSASYKLIFILGEEALKSSGTLNNVPIVFGGGRNPYKLNLGKNICGIDMNYNPQLVLEVLKETFPKLETVGIIYNAEISENIITEAKRIFNSGGVEIMAYPAQTSTDVFSGLNFQMAGKIDVFWMIFDPVVTNSTSVDHILKFSIRENMPIFVPSEDFVRKGGFLGIKDDYKSDGEEMAHLAKTILSAEKKPDEIGIKYSESKGVVINLKMGEKLGFKFNRKIVQKAITTY